MASVWVDTWPIDYSGNCGAAVYASKELAVQAGAVDAIECVLVDSLPAPWSWIKRGVLITDGVAGDESTKCEDFTFTQDHQAWIGTHATIESGPPHRHWLRVEMWAPNTDENNSDFDVLLSQALSGWRTMETGYRKWDVACPAPNHIRTVTSKWEEE